jgi:hypothetical protein
MKSVENQAAIPIAAFLFGRWGKGWATCGVATAREILYPAEAGFRMTKS